MVHRSFPLAVVGAFACAWSMAACAEDLVDTSPTLHDGPPASTGLDAASPSPLTDAGGSAPDAASEPPVDSGSPVDAATPVEADDAGPRVGCTTVAHVGDSLTAYTKDPLKAAYAAVSITAQIDAYGGRAILQRVQDDPKTGKQAALDFVAGGYKGCWVVALGTNDTANAALDPSLSRAKAIDAMLNAIDANKTTPVMWVNTFTTKTDGYWANANMKIWNDALNAARDRWPNLRVFDWASIAKTGKAPFTDGIHHTAEGYDVRNAAIAKAASEL